MTTPELTAQSRPTLKPINIGPVTIDEPVLLAPMTGVTDKPFRVLVRRYGSGLNVTEMIASEAAIRETRQSIQKAEWDETENPVSMQLVGCDPGSMGEAAKLQEGNGAAIIDINFGCPVRKVVGQLAGSALMREVPLATKLMEATVKAVDVPVTVKMRMGWDHQSLNAPELARIAEDLGVKMITVHGRTRNQMYKGNPMGLYKDLFNGKTIAFDLTSGGNVVFKSNKNHTMSTSGMVRDVTFPIELDLKAFAP